MFAYKIQLFENFFWQKYEKPVDEDKFLYYWTIIFLVGKIKNPRS